MKIPRSRVVLLLWFAFLVTCGFIIATTRFTADMSAFLPSKPTEEQQLLVDQLSDGVVSRMILIGIEGSDEKSRLQLSAALGKQLRKSPQFVSVSNGEQVSAQRDRNLLLEYRYLLSPAVTPERFTASGLHDAIVHNLSLMASSTGLLLKQLLPRDPTGEMVQLFNEFSGSSHPQTQNGLWVSRDGKRALLIAQTRATGSDTDGQQLAIETIRAHFAQAVKALGPQPSNAKLLLSGPGVISVSARHTIKSEVTRLALISVSLIVVLLLTIYRSFSALGLGLLPVVSGAIAGISAVSLGFGEVHGITIGFGTTLIGEAVDYSIYLFVQSQGREQADTQDWINTFWPTIQLGVVTSLIGFSVLLFSDFPGLSQLGMYSMAGLVTAALVTRFVLPVLLPTHFRIRDVSHLGTLLQPVLQHAAKLRGLILLLVIASSLILYQHRHTLWNSELSSLSPVTPEQMALDSHLRADLGAPDTRYMIVISGDSLQEVLSSSEKVSAQLQPLVTDGTIAGFQSPTRYLPSVATQRARQAALPPRDELRQRLSEATQDLPLRAERLTPFLNDMAKARQLAPLQLADLEGSSFGLATNALLLHQDNRWRALLPLQSTVAHGVVENIDPQPLRSAIAAAGQDNALFVDMKGESDRLYADYLHEALAFSLAGFIAIIALLLIKLRSLRRVLRIIAPLTATVLLVTAALALAGEQLIILHLIGMLLIVAVGSNYALFFDRSSSDSSAAHSTHTLASLLIANLTTVCGFGLLAFSSVPVLHAIGIMVGPGAILALLLSASLAQRSERWEVV